MKNIFCICFFVALTMAACDTSSVSPSKEDVSSDRTMEYPATSFFDPNFDPFPPTELDIYFTEYSEDFFETFASGLSVTSDYISTHAEDDYYSADALTIMNAYLISVQEDTFTTLPDVFYDFDENDELSAAVETAITDILENISFSEDTLSEVTYLEFVDAVNDFNPGSLSESQIDTVVRLLYISQMSLHWMFYEPLWYEEVEEELGTNQINTRIFKCKCMFCGCSIWHGPSVSMEEFLDCAIPVLGGVLVGLSGTGGNPLGGIGGGLLAGREWCRD